MTRKPQTREERLAAALRENLKRRKEAARALTRRSRAAGCENAPDRPNAAKKVD